ERISSPPFPPQADYFSKSDQEITCQCKKKQIESMPHPDGCNEVQPIMKRVEITPSQNFAGRERSHQENEEVKKNPPHLLGRLYQADKPGINIVMRPTIKQSNDRKENRKAKPLRHNLPSPNFLFPLRRRGNAFDPRREPFFSPHCFFI